MHNPIYVFVGPQTAGANGQRFAPYPTFKDSNACAEGSFQFIKVSPRAVVLLGKTPGSRVFGKTEPNRMDMQLNILLGCAEPIDDALHGLIAEIEVIGTLDKKSSLDIVAIEGFQNKTQGLFFAIDDAINHRLSDRPVDIRLIDVAGNTKFGIDRDTNLCTILWRHLHLPSTYRLKKSNLWTRYHEKARRCSEVKAGSAANLRCGSFERKKWALSHVMEYIVDQSRDWSDWPRKSYENQNGGDSIKFGVCCPQTFSDANET